VRKLIIEQLMELVHDSLDENFEDAMDRLEFSLDFDLGIVNLDEGPLTRESIEQSFRECSDEMLLTVFTYFITDWSSLSTEA
jgi:hypothetical protein